VKRQQLDLRDLFSLEGRYTYSNGINWKAISALVLGILPVTPGFVRAAMTAGGQVADPNVFDKLYTYAWFVTFALSFAFYLILMRGTAREHAEAPAWSHPITES
jgi:nucleobase:cation symporter-1, NCS1 family